MKFVATFVIVLVIGHAYSLAAKNSSSNTKAASGEKLSAPKNATSIAKEAAGEKKPVPKNPTPSANDAEQVAPGVTVSKGFKRGNCLASRFAVLCASSSSVNGCITKNSKTKCGKQCVCGTKECACGTSGCYCQVDGGCHCNGSK